jgi:triosephosphate isomerase
MPRQFLVGGNWKMNGTPALVCEIANALNNLKINVEVVVAPPFPLLLHMRHNLTSGMHVAAQNCGDVLNGAHTGETSATLLKELGVNWVILGHSERREIYKESDSTVAKKVKLAVNCGLTIIACIGEKLNERESGQTFDVIFRQLLAIKNELNENDWKNIVIAYEPVWAIGTGKVATPTQAQEVHEQIRTWLTQNVIIFKKRFLKLFRAKLGFCTVGA